MQKLYEYNAKEGTVVEDANLTAEDAARILGVSLRTIREYVKQGLLATHKKPGSSRKWFYAEDVHGLQAAREEEGQIIGSVRKAIAKLSAENRRLRHEVDAIMRILDTQDKPLRITADYSRQLHSTALLQLKEPAWTLDQMNSWCVVFSRLSEDDLQVMANSTQDLRPWVPFLKLCLRMTEYVVDSPIYAQSLEMQTLHRELAEARRRLRISAMCFMDLHGYDVDKAIKSARLADTPQSIQDLLRKAVK